MPQPLDLIGGFYQDESLPWACQDTVNWIPEAAEAQGTRTPTILRDAPGLRPKVQVGEGPIRGMRNVEGKLLVVSGNTLYQISNELIAIPRGTIPGTGLVSMAHNARSGGNQVVIVNGAAGYVYDTNLLTLEKITDAGYPGAFVVDFVDGYMAQIEPLRRYWFHSELTNALEYNTLDRYPAEGQPDALVTLLVDHREVWVFGERTIEPFVNTGAATNTFARASNTVIEHGCSAKFSPAKLDNSIFWLDELGIVRRAQGYTAVRVSTGPIEQAIASLDWKRAFGFTMTENGHAVYYLTFPDGYTFGYDIVTGLWHRRASYGLDRWRVNGLVYWNGEYIAGDFQQGLLYGLDWAYPFDGDLPHVRSRRTGVTHNNQDRVLVPYAELIVDTGREAQGESIAPPQPLAPSITGAAPDEAISTAYSYAYTVTGSATPLVVTLLSGELPPGLSLSTAGVLSGTTGGSSGVYSFTLRVTDANGLFDDLNDGIAIGAFLEKWDSGVGMFATSGTPGTFQDSDYAIRAEYIAGASGIVAQSVVPITGKRYFEFEVENSANINAGRFRVGVHYVLSSNWPTSGVEHTGIRMQSSANAQVFSGPLSTVSVGTFGWSSTTTGTARVRMAVDVPNHKVWFGINGGVWTSGDPELGTGGYDVNSGTRDVWLYGDLDNIGGAQVRRIEIVIPADWDYSPPAGFA
jgi:hypothetical protein